MEDSLWNLITSLKTSLLSTTAVGIQFQHIVRDMQMITQSNFSYK